MATLGAKPVREVSRADANLPTFGGGGATPPPLMERGTMLANGRYEILEILGQGAMGAVYKAKDHELDRWVAIKVIQPELSSSSAMLKRFKQELIMARQVTHRNVIRIFDIGETDGMKFITMEYIDGGDLKSVIIERGKIPPEEAVGIVRQICHALDAAHTEGVVHRDLKPQNIMIDQNDRVVVMDFGIAQSKELPGMTMTGALMGTPEYMSPEQAKGDKTDTRADIFAVGIIFYEMLIGKVPFKAKTVVETMYKRTQERAVPPVDLDSSVPIQANRIVMKCLETDPAARYQSAKELLQDLEAFDPEQKISALDRVRRTLKQRSRFVATMAAVLAVILVALAAGFLLRDRFRSREVTHPPETVLVADFSNHTGNPIFDGTLEPVVKLGLEGAGFITAYDRSQLRALGAKPVAKLDETTAGQVAVSVGVGVVVSGSLDQQGNEFLVRMKATRAVSGNTIVSTEGTASNKDQVMFETGRLVSAVRRALGDETPEASQRFALETFTNASLEVVHEYILATQAQSNSNNEEALKGYAKVIDLDENFAMAYRGMAFTYQNMRQNENAEKYIKLALSHIDRMTERERYRTRASYYALLGDRQKCLEEYGALISRYPSDSTAHNNLAYCATQLRDMTKALEHVRQAAAIFPKRPSYRANISMYALYGSDFPTAEKEAQALLQLDPSHVYGFLATALAQLGMGQLPQATETFQKLEKLSKAGASQAASGLADIALYEGRFSDAARILEQAANADLTDKSTADAATKFVILANARLLQGQNAQAVAAADKALANSRALKIRFLAGRVFAAAGQAARAQKLAAELATELQDEPRSYAKLIEGVIALEAGNARQAINTLRESNALLDTWISRFDLGRAYLAAGAFPEADSEFDRCIRRRGEAMALFLDESPTYSFFAPVYYYQGRVREGMKSSGSSESYRSYLSIRGKSSEDPLLPEVRKRAGQ